MKLYMISDCHLGDGTARDDFHEDDWLWRLCDEVDSQKNATLVVVGDILEGWQCKFEDIVVVHREVVVKMKRLSDTKKLILISGNHDMELKKAISFLFDVPVLDIYKIGSTLFMHGHQFDPMCSKYKWIGHTVSWIGGALEYAVNRDIDKWFEKLSQKITRKGRHGDEELYAMTAIDFIKDKGGADTIVIGHTHKLCREYKVGGKIYRNTGTAMKQNLLIMEV